MYRYISLLLWIISQKHRYILLLHGSFCKSTDTFRFCTGSFCKTTCAAHFTHKKFRNDAERSSVRRYSSPAITRVSRALKWSGVIRRPVRMQSFDRLAAAVIVLG